MKNLTIFAKINESKYKLAPTLCSVALATAILPVCAYAADDTLVNHTVTIYTEKGTEITLTGEELEKFLNVDGDTVAIYQDGEIIQINKSELEKATNDNQKVTDNDFDTRILGGVLSGIGFSISATVLLLSKIK